MLLNPKTETFEHLDPESRELMKKTVEFFENKGKAKLKEASHERIWYQDFIDFLKENQVFAKLLTPAPYARMTRTPAGTPTATAILMKFWVFTTFPTGMPGRFPSWAWAPSG